MIAPHCRAMRHCRYSGSYVPLDAIAMIAIARHALVAVILFVPLSGLLVACASHPAPQAEHHGTADAAILVPDGRSALAKGLRQALTGRGWHLISHHGDLIRPRADYRALARRAKYRLTLTASPAGSCRNGEPSYRYRIAMIENANGAVPVALSGVDCLATILDEFAGDLDQKRLTPVSARASAKP